MEITRRHVQLRPTRRVTRWRDKAKQAEYMRAWVAKNREKIAAYRLQRKSREKELRHQRKIRDPEKYKVRPVAWMRAWRAANPDRVKAYQAKHALWLKNNRDKVNAWQRRRQKEKRMNPAQRIKDGLYNRISMAIRARKAGKERSTKKLLGCDIAFLMGYLEARFLKGMTWENYGRTGWHVDHVIPCAEFDLTEPDQQRQCFHYSNLKPMWSVDNIRKGRSMPPTHQAELI